MREYFQTNGLAFQLECLLLLPAGWNTTDVLSTILIDHIHTTSSLWLFSFNCAYTDQWQRLVQDNGRLLCNWACKCVIKRLFVNLSATQFIYSTNPVKKNADCRQWQVTYRAITNLNICWSNLTIHRSTILMYASTISGKVTFLNWKSLCFNRRWLHWWSWWRKCGVKRLLRGLLCWGWKRLLTKHKVMWADFSTLFNIYSDFCFFLKFPLPFMLEGDWTICGYIASWACPLLFI